MPDIVAVILVVSVLLALVSLILPLVERFDLPATSLLAALGVAIGFLAHAVAPLPGLGLLGDILSGVATFRVPADVFLVIFLPPLLFTAALTIDVRLLFDELPAVLLMAVVAVAVATAVVGYGLFLVADIGLLACLLLGAIVATTDPAAVISIFRDLGAPRRLTTLVAGESLFNDAAAIAFFALLLEAMVGQEGLSAGAAFETFVLDFSGGLLVGLVLALVTGWLLHRLRGHPLAEITVTVSLAYLSYIVADRYLGVSGVIAVVAAGLTFAARGRTRLRADTWEPLVHTWMQLEFWANSLIFLLTAILASQIIPTMGLADLGLLLVLVLAALAARALVLFGLLPALVLLRLTEPVTVAHKSVILWGGLRGAVTLVLALSVTQNPFLAPEVRAFVGQLAVGYVLFTLFVGAPTLRPLLRVLGLDRLSETERALRDRVMALSRVRIREQIGQVGQDYGFPESTIEKVTPAASEDQEATPPMPLSAESRLQVGLLTLANREKELYLEHMAEGTVSRRMVGLRSAAADRIIDRVKTRGSEGYEASSRREVSLSKPFRLGLWLYRRFGVDSLLARQVADRFESLLVGALVVRELRRFNRESVKPVLGQGTADALDELLGARLQMVEDALSAVELQFPNFAAMLRQQYLARAGLRLEEAEYRRKLDEALISREVFNDLSRRLARRRQEVERQPRLDLGQSLTRMLRGVKLFSELPQDKLSFVARLLRPRFMLPGELIVRRGDRGTAMYFIVTGKVEVDLGPRQVELGPGDFFGELALLTNQPRNADVSATSYCHLLVLDAADFRRLLRADAALKETIESVADSRLERNRAAREG